MLPGWGKDELLFLQVGCGEGEVHGSSHGLSKWGGVGGGAAVAAVGLEDVVGELAFLEE